MSTKSQDNLFNLKKDVFPSKTKNEIDIDINHA